jgi:hypothetical protein
VSTVVLAGAAMKAWLILLGYLEFRRVPPGWRRLFAAWIALVSVSAWAETILSLLRT